MQQHAFVMPMALMFLSFGAAAANLPVEVSKPAVSRPETKGGLPGNFHLASDSSIVDSIVEVPAREVAHIVQTLRNEVCPSMGSGQITVWLKGETSGKFIIIGAKTGAGLEVKVDCAPANPTSTTTSTP